MLRRDLFKSAAAGAGLTILKSGMLRGQTAPSNKLNIALIGVWGRGTAHYNVLPTRTWWRCATSTTAAPRRRSRSSPKPRPTGTGAGCSTRRTSRP